MNLTKTHVARLRAFHGMTLKEFAARVGVSYVTIHRIETGDLNITEKMQSRIVAAFDLSGNKLRSVTIHHRKNISPYKDIERQKAVCEELEAASNE